jgi:hypothetical protein
LVVPAPAIAASRDISSDNGTAERVNWHWRRNVTSNDVNCSCVRSEHVGFAE